MPESFVHFTLRDDDVFDDAGLRRLLAAKSNSLRIARANGLPSFKKFQRIYYRGSDVRRWLFADQNPEGGAP